MRQIELRGKYGNKGRADYTQAASGGTGKRISCQKAENHILSVDNP